MLSQLFIILITQRINRMINTIYIEKKIEHHQRTLLILSKFKNPRIIYINHHSEIFNKKNQNFRVQKSDPSIILAYKYNNLVLDSPKGFGIGSDKNFYFSHMYNCIYDCKYCFLQGLYSSANYLIFVNYEDFIKKIDYLIKKFKNKSLTFFSGYDCDSLAMEKITGFGEFFLKNLIQRNDIIYEFRTKSLQKKIFLDYPPINNVVIAYSLLPENLSYKFDNKVPDLNKRVDLIKKLSSIGWNIGLRFDPLIFSQDWKFLYENLIDNVLFDLDLEKLHSISFGALRFPKQFFYKIMKMYPGEELFFENFEKKNNIFTYKKNVEIEMISFCKKLIYKKLGKEVKIFSCNSF